MKNTNLLIIGAVVLLVLGGGGYYFMSMNKPATPGTAVMEEKKDDAMMEESSGAAMMEGKEKAITMAEIEKHATKDDCWFAIEGNVYEVTQYIADGKHPGKDAIIAGCGKDATEMFNKRADGEPHSEKARSFLPNFKIGVLSQ